MTTKLQRLEEHAARLEQETEHFTVPELMEKIESMDLQSLARLQAQLRDLHEALDRSKSAVGKVYDYVRTGAVPNKMEEEGVENMAVTGVGRVSLTSDIYLKVNDKEASFEWLTDNGQSGLIQETVNSSSLKALQESEWQRCLDLLSSQDPAPGYIVASGSLPQSPCSTSPRFDFF